ncbi:Hypothetical protein D9617_24g017160 [Elsinoe fawcettii]|nr:Hypothetical protein D9617_24g017160 [Elsinoe fawcettii]
MYTKDKRPVSFDAERDGPRMLLSIRVFNILAEYTRDIDTVTLPETIDKLLECSHGVGFSAWLFNDTCTDLALQIPYDHPTHLRLAKLLKAILLSGPPLSPLLQKLEEHNFPRFEGTVSGLNDDLPRESKLIAEYVRHQSFLACLTHLGFPLKAFETYALKEAFITSRTREEMRATREAQVMGAAQWVIWDTEGTWRRLKGETYLLALVTVHSPVVRQEGERQGLWRRVVRQVPSRSRGARRLWGMVLPGMGGQRPLRGELEEFGIEGLDDWGFVKRSFVAVGRYDRYGEKCREVAAYAEEVMTRHEKKVVEGE